MILTVLGAVVLVVAVYALNQQPKGKSVGNAAATRSSSARTSAVPSSFAKSSSRSKSSSSVVPPADSGGPAGTDAPSAAKQIPIVVLNNTTMSGLAKQAATRFRNGGWTVSDTGNLKNDIVSTCAYYDPTSAGAKAAAQVLQEQYPTIKRVEKRFTEDSPAAPIVVVLTPDYSSN